MNFTRLVAATLTLNLYGACVGVYISTTSRGYTSAETGQPFFDCFRSAPDLQAKVGVDRYVYTYNSIVNPANGLPPLPTFYRAGNPSTEVYRINLHTSYHRSYGVFYCSAALDGEYSAVPTIFLRSDAKFVPRRGRFTKTVNRGDVDVTVEFTEVTPSDTSKEWRFNGTTVAMDTISHNISPRMRKRPVYTIKGKVNTSHSGVYEIHVPGQRSQARAGLQRLIVRACPAGRYNESSGCTQFCSSCYNGGICHDQTGDCICAPGFQGYSCEIACGGNRFGRNCEYRCDYDVSDDKTACSGLQVCVPDPYGCSCTPGYKGLNCTTECDTGEFGASCSETCHCVSGECDRFTGVCTGSSSNCLSSWTGTSCQGQQGAPPPSEIEAESVSSVIIVTWNASHPLHLNGHIMGYTIDYKKISPIHEGAHSKVIKTAQTTNIMYVIDGVKEGEEYEIQVNTVNVLGPGKWSETLRIKVLEYRPRNHAKKNIAAALISSCMILVVLGFLLWKRGQCHRTPRTETDDENYDKCATGISDSYVELYERPSNGTGAYQDLDRKKIQGIEAEYSYVAMSDVSWGGKQ